MNKSKDETIETRKKRSATQNAPITADEQLLANIGDDWPRYHQSSCLQDAVLTASKHTQVSYEMALSTALGIMAAACQGLVDVAMPNHHKTPVSLMLLILAESGERKTSLLSLFTEPLNHFQKEKDEEKKDEEKKHLNAIKVWNLKRKAIEKTIEETIKTEGHDAHTSTLEKQLNKLDESKPNTQKYYKLIYQNTTTQALTRGMHENIPLAFLLTDEAESAVNGPLFKDTTTLNTLWSGKGEDVARVTKESYTLKNPRLSATFMIQPAIFNDFMEGPKGKKAGDSGLLARFLIVQPESRIGKRKAISPHIDQKSLDKFYSRVSERMQESFDAVKKGRDKTLLTFTPDAKQLWANINERIESEMSEHSIYTNARAHASKLMEQISRIAAVIHTFENDNYHSEIKSEDLYYAYKLARHYSRHFLEYVTGTPEIVTNANALVAFIKKEHAKKNGITEATSYPFIKSKVTQYGPSRVRAPGPQKEVFDFLIKLGHLKQDPNSISKLTLYENALECLATQSKKEPELKNGELYYIEELPKFSQCKVDIAARWGPRYYLES